MNHARELLNMRLTRTSTTRSMQTSSFGFKSGDVHPLTSIDLTQSDSSMDLYAGDSIT